jgi:hypothetical protein
MEGLLVGLGIVVVGVLLLTVVGSVVRAALWLLLLPFRMVGWLLFLPLLLIKLVIGLVAVVLTPVVAVVAATLAAIVAGLFLPLLPVLVIAGFVWLLVKAARRPSHRPVVS